MSRYRLQPTPQQADALLLHCRHARFVWNLAVEQHSFWTPDRRSAPGYLEQSRQLTEARREFEWLRDGSQTVQQQALRDFSQAMCAFFNGTHRPPTWRKAGVNEGFRMVAFKPAHLRRLSKNVGAVRIPKVGWTKFRWSRLPPAAKSYRVTLDRSGRWHIAFAAIPPEIKAPGREEVVGIDRGVAVTIALSTGELLIAPQLRPAEQRRFEHLARKLSRAQPGSTRRGRIKLAVARLLARQRDRRRDWIEKQTTMLAGRFDVIKLEDLRVGQMTRSARRTREHPGVGVRRKSQLNRRVRDSAWGMIAQRLRDKAAGRVEFVRAAFTSQRCHRCGHTARENRKSQAAFRCVTCGHTDHADVNAAKNIAAGHAVTARGGQPLGRPANREPHRSTSPVSG
ncbi:transposase [Kribbella sp. NBC_01505]|uniref:RNA-guided endonuclease InsQ/TnpB family protein n=1 Tax=Kribbella sp. NBC_01505 TaxID=2903580 RepID=UPI003869125A